MMNRYKGKVYFYKYVGLGPHSLLFCGIPHEDEAFKPPKDTVVIGSCEVDVELDTDTRQAEVEALNTEIMNRCAAHQLWLDMMNGKIQSLLAIEHSEVSQ